MDVPLIAAGLLALVAAAIHGGAGEVLVVRRLPTEALHSTRFGGPRMTMAMIHVTWHIATIAFLALGSALLVAGSVLEDEVAQAVAVVAAAAFTGFGILGLAIGGVITSPRGLLRHPGPLVFVATAALAWWGAQLT